MTAVAAVRDPSVTFGSPVPIVVVGDLSRDTHYDAALDSIDAVIHLSARVHVMRETEANPLLAFRRSNVEGTVTLARQAAAKGVRRFVYLSSVKVNGEEGLFQESDIPNPQDAYGMSKLEAELALREVASATGMEVVIVRPPLVYGRGVRANFRQMIRLVRSGLPLPLGAVNNRRSFIAVENLADFLVLCTRHPLAANQLFLVSDGEDLSTSQLIRRLAAAMGRPARLIFVPTRLLTAAAALMGKRDIAIRLLGSLQVNSSKARELLDWKCKLSVDEALRMAVRKPVD